MGGRGASRVRKRYQPEPMEREYEVITRDSLRGRASYAFLDQLDRNWAVLTHPARESVDYLPQDTFGMASPTLRWVNGDQVVDLFVDGMSTDTFLEATGLALNLDKGGFVLSKRLSRILRPQYVTAFLGAEDVEIRFLDLDAHGEKIWDGAGVVSRRMLERMIDHLPEVSPAKRAQLIRELKHGQRVEFTLMTADGQLKGHALVSDTLASDFLLPSDIKREVKLTDGCTFVGFNFVHGHTDMRLDIQSLINLHPFFDETQLAKWLKDEGDLFLHAIETGEVGSVMARIDKFTTLDEVQSWPLREYLASGGHPMAFASHVKSFANQHLARLNHATLGKMRLPIPGGRVYVMPAGVGGQAGLDVQVGRGEILVDPDHATAWVNDDDWVQLTDSTEGIAGILGGADNDDALWVHGFTDFDGARKVLAWRSPNQAGEYVVLKPTADSHSLAWETLEGAVEYPAGDSRKLMTRIDHMNPTYLGLVDPATAGGLGEGEDYTIAVMDKTIERVMANQACLGAYCNALMLAKAVYNRLPQHPPAPLEDVIDGSVKLGTDLSPVLDWVQATSTQMLAQRQPIPESLHRRLGSVPEGTPGPVASMDHWLDRLVGAVEDHIQVIQQGRDRLVQRTMPPREIFDYAFTRPQSIQLGARLNQTYTRLLKSIAEQKPTLTAEDYDLARQTAEAYLYKFPPGMQSDILRGAIVSAYMRDEVGSDAAVWLAGEKIDGGRAKGMGGGTIEALREIGVLDELLDTDAGILTYPGATVHPIPYRTMGIQGVWRRYFEAWTQQQNMPIDDLKSRRAKQGIRLAKQQVQAQAERQVPIHLTVRDEQINGEIRKVAYGEDGSVFGVLSRDSDWVSDTLTIRFSLAHDGNLRAVVELDDVD